MRRLAWALLAVMALLVATLAPAGAADREDSVRFATFNASLNRGAAGDLAAELAAPGSPQPATIAEIIQRTRPDVLLINEFDFDEAHASLAVVFPDHRGRVAFEHLDQ